jgi:hypothetical protein
MAPGQFYNYPCLFVRSSEVKMLKHETYARPLLCHKGLMHHSMLFINVKNPNQRQSRHGRRGEQIK